MCHDVEVAASRDVDEDQVARTLRAAGARFAFVHGSRADGQRARPDSDLDVAAWWGTPRPPDSWTVETLGQVDLLVLDRAPLWLAGRVAQHARLLFDDDPPARVRWQADTRLRYLDDLPALQNRRRASIKHSVAAWSRG